MNAEEILKRKQKLIRDEKGDVARYRIDNNPAPGVYRSARSRTIVPKDGDIDREISLSQQQLYAENQKPGINMASGGFVPDERDPFSTENQPTTIPTVPVLPGMTPPAPTPSPLPMNTAPSVKLPGMPEGTDVNEIEPYLTGKKQALDKYGPEEMMATQNNINTQRDSFNNRLTSGVKGFADAIMMGVARAGNPGWQESYDQQMERAGQQNLDTLAKANDANLKRTEAGMSLDKMDPKSALSQQAQQTYAPLFEKLGYNAGDIHGMSSANIDSAMQLMAAYGGKEVEAQIKQYEMEIERARMAAAAGKQASSDELERLRLAEAMKKQQMDAELANRKSKVDAATEVLKRSGNAKVLGIPIPFTSDVSGKDQKKAQQVLVDEMNASTPTASTTEVLSPRDQEALDWAQQNPSDSRAVEIRKRLGR